MTPTISIQNLSKKYRLGQRFTGGYRDLRDVLMNWATAPFRKARSVYPSSNGKAARPETIWALQDVSFQVQHGEVVGIIGRNGAGKSTLLKILSQIVEPTKGRAELRGRVGSLLEVGTGFHPDLTGRENVYLNGSILGMTRREVDRKFDEIVDFSGVEDFLDTPVKRYSSGMKVRLAFAVAAHLEPEIMIIDEVLAVGDLEFQRRCLGKMEDVANSGRTVLFVSHNMAAVRALCSRGILLDAGQVRYDGTPDEAISRYNEITRQPEHSLSFPIQAEEVDLEEFVMVDQHKQTRSRFSFEEPFWIRLRVHLKKALRNVHVFCVLWRTSDRVLVTSFGTKQLPLDELGVGTTTFTVGVEGCRLFPGEYTWTVQVKAIKQKFLEVEKALSLQIEKAILPGAPRPYLSAHGCIHLPTSFYVEKSDNTVEFFRMTDYASAPLE
ncbi:MAG: polysaccharide ABC transporter ATP-binding protein [Gemmataceae bacterium]